MNVSIKPTPNERVMIHNVDGEIVAQHQKFNGKTWDTVYVYEDVSVTVYPMKDKHGVVLRVVE